ncbi:MAG TPA: hypothetical protein VJO14_08050, partial [Bacteroidota bacterium]|nr:hypothetical protein [Bacteroidota bacterium]
LSRADNRNALETLRKNGIIFTALTSKDEAESYALTGRAARGMLVGKLYDADLLGRLEAALESYRRSAADSAR